ncbi:hypothetical protein [Streptomyces collinus]|uniref:hypothetical protein n=1 Tax=Streptomyces collinus TaxID=42684 RepID=UPI0033E244B0
MARAIVAAVADEQPPRRLLLGSDALDIALKAEEARLAEAHAWSEVSRSVGHH